MTPAELPVEHHFSELNGTRLHWVELGKGPLVVLLHGFPETWWSWRYQLPALAAAGFRAVAMDLRGFGDSAVRGPYDMATHTTDVCQLIESLGETKARIVGHDWGGGIAWHLAAHRPERCERLAVLNCPHPQQMMRAFFQRPSPTQLSKSWYMFFFQLPLLPEWLFTRDDASLVLRLLKASNPGGPAKPDEELQPFREALRKKGTARSMIGIYRAALKDALAGKHASWPRIEARTLLLWGLNDPALSFDALVPGTELRVPHLAVERVEGAGHFVQSDAPERVNARLVEFFSRSG